MIISVPPSTTFPGRCGSSPCLSSGRFTRLPGSGPEFGGPSGHGRDARPGPFGTLVTTERLSIDDQNIVAPVRPGIAQEAYSQRIGTLSSGEVTPRADRLGS